MQRRNRSLTVGSEDIRRCRFEDVISHTRILQSWWAVKTLEPLKVIDLTKPIWEIKFVNNSYVYSFFFIFFLILLIIWDILVISNNLKWWFHWRCQWGCNERKRDQRRWWGWEMRRREGYGGLRDMWYGVLGFWWKWDIGNWEWK